MSISESLAALFHRDLTRLVQQLRAFPGEGALWQRHGTLNSAGNLTLHLEGNLREFIGRQLGGVPYQRDRAHEFAGTGFPIEALASRIEETRAVVCEALSQLTPRQLDAVYPQEVLGVPLTTAAFLIHLHGHFNYHLGQIDCLRRHSTGAAAVNYAGL